MPLFVLFAFLCSLSSMLFFFFNDTATTEIYTLSLHDALPIYPQLHPPRTREAWRRAVKLVIRSEEHTSELQSRLHLVCRLLLEKKKTHRYPYRSRHNRATRPNDRPLYSR